MSKNQTPHADESCVRGGVIGGLPGQGNSIHEEWSVTHIGTQLIISRSTILPSDKSDVRSKVTRGSMWQLDGSDRLVIEFGEERLGERPKTATRTYVKGAPP